MTSASAAQSFVIGVDLGTGGPKVALATARGELAGLESASVPTRILPDGGAEQDPDDWWLAIADCVRKLLAGHEGSAERVSAICFSSQWGGTVPVDSSGRATHPALIWMDARGAQYAREVTGGWPPLPGSGYGPRKLRAWVAKTGGVPTRTGQDPVGQTLWLANRRPDAYAAARYLLDVPEYLTMRACGRAVTAFDTAVLRWCTDNRDPRRVRWDPSLAAAAHLDLGKLPEIVAPASVVGTLTAQAAADLGREHARTGARPFETEPETAARLADVLREKGCALPGDDPSPRELLWEYRFAFGHEKAGLPQPGPSRPHRNTASPAELAGQDFPASAGRPPGAAADTRLAVSTLRPPRALNQANGRQHR